MNASLNDPFDPHKMEADKEFKKSYNNYATSDLRNSSSKLDFENHETFENFSRSGFASQFTYEGASATLGTRDVRGQEVRDLPLQSQALVRANEEHVVHSLQSLEYVLKLCIPGRVEYLTTSELLPKVDDRKLAIFDMDETLIHTLYKRNKNSQEMKETELEYDAKVPIVNADGSLRYLFINIRPYVMEVLRLLKRNFRIAVFTASLKTYADAILDYLDPEGEVFEARYYRHHCHVTQDRVYIKDLRIF